MGEKAPGLPLSPSLCVLANTHTHTHMSDSISPASDDDDVMHIFSLLKSQTQETEEETKINTHTKMKKKNQQQRERAQTKLCSFVAVVVISTVWFARRANKCRIELSITNDYGDHRFVCHREERRIAMG